MIVAFFVGLLMALMGFLATLFWIWVLIDCLSKEPSKGNDKLIWTLVIVSLHGIGALIYFFLRRSACIQLYGR